MNKPNCRFKKSLNKIDMTYNASFKGLSKIQLNILMSIFQTLNSVGVIQEYENGVTMPKLELRCSVPLASSVSRAFRVPNSDIYALASLFRNYNINPRDVLLNSCGTPLSNIRPHGYEY